MIVSSLAGLSGLRLGRGGARVVSPRPFLLPVVLRVWVMFWCFDTFRVIVPGNGKLTSSGVACVSALECERGVSLWLARGCRRWFVSRGVGAY